VLAAADSDCLISDARRCQATSLVQAARYGCRYCRLQIGGVAYRKTQMPVNKAHGLHARIFTAPSDVSASAGH